MEKFDIGIVGAGPAGYTLAIQAGLQGKKVIIFEKENIGGVCLNKGCIPTKSILHASELFSKFKNCEEYGISAQNLQLDYSKVIDKKNQTLEKLRKGIELGLKNAKVTVIKGSADIKNSHEIIANDETYYCEEVVCAIGSSPKTVKGLEFDHEFLLSSDDLLNLEELPKNILIVGSGAIGIEWARIMSNFGIETTVLELAQHLLPLADIEVSKRVERIFKSKKIKFYTETSIEKIENKSVTLSNGEILTPEKILVAIGRSPNTTEKIEGVKYIGDVAGEIQLAHYAIKKAFEEVEKIPFRQDLTPSVVYGCPEIAWVGKREQDLTNGEFEKGTFLISALGKSHCDGETEGFIKLLAKDNRIIGAHIVSNEASSLLQQILIAMQNDITIDKLKEVCFAHPTYSEGIFETLFRIK